MKAAQKYPNFCNESNFDTYNDGETKIHSCTELEWKQMSEDEKEKYTADQTCKHELATLFAHWSQETGYNDASKAEPLETWQQALYYVEEYGCH